MDDGAEVNGNAEDARLQINVLGQTSHSLDFLGHLRFGRELVQVFDDVFAVPGATGQLGKHLRDLVEALVEVRQADNRVRVLSRVEIRPVPVKDDDGGIQILVE